MKWFARALLLLAFVTSVGCPARTPPPPKTPAPPVNPDEGKAGDADKSVPKFN